MSLSKDNVSDMTKQAMGYQGGVYTANTSAITGDFIGFQVLADCIFTVLTAPNLTNAAAVVSNAQVFPVGYYPIEMTAYTLASGVVVAYRA